MSMEKLFRKANNMKYGSVVVLLIAFLMLGSTITSVLGSDNNQNSQIEEINYFKIGEGSVDVTIPIGEYDIKNTDLGDELYIEDFGRLLVPGKPNLPSKIFSIAIPPGAKIIEVTFKTDEGLTIPGTFEVPPSDLPRVIGEEDPIIYEQEIKSYESNYNGVYTTNKPYPSSTGEFIRKAGYRKYNLVDVRITPFTYYPLSGVLKYHSWVDVNVRYNIPDDFSYTDVMSDNILKTEKLAEKIIINYEQTKNWYPIDNPRSSNDFVIITLDSLTSSVTPLVNWEEAKGRSVEVVTTTWIESNYAGYDLAEKMRNFLREKYPTSEWGIEHVLLVGDYDDVPMRLCWQDEGYGKPETDYYYAELSLPDSESWDSDGDHRYGENSDPIDFYNEVNVGRIPWSDPDTILHICEKSVAYEQNNDPSFKKNILLLGAFFWPDTDNAVLMEEKVDQEWMQDWTMTRMYEEGHSSYPMDYDLTNSNVVSVWSQGSYAFVNWAGHGSYDACWIYYDGGYFICNDDCLQLNDDYPAIIFADACSNSDTDYLNIGKAMLKQGSVGFLGSTKVAYGMHGWNNPYSGSSQSLDYFFTTCVTSGEYTQGEAQQWGLIEMYTNGLWYYERLETFEWGALWGNPDLGMGTGGMNMPPSTPDVPQGPDNGEAGIEYTFTTSTIDPENNDVYYMWNWGNELSEWLGPYDSGETVQIPHTWYTAGEFEIKVKAKDESGAESSWSDIKTINIIAMPIIEIGEITGGFGISAVIQNVGIIEAENVEWTIQLQGLVLFGKEKTGTFEKIMPGFSPKAETGFVFGIGPTQITVTADNDEKTATGLIIGPFVIISG